MIATPKQDNPEIAAAVDAIRHAPHWVLIVQTGEREVGIMTQVPGDSNEDVLHFMEEIERALVAGFNQVRQSIAKAEARP